MFTQKNVCVSQDIYAYLQKPSYACVLTKTKFMQKRSVCTYALHKRSLCKNKVFARISSAKQSYTKAKCMRTKATLLYNEVYAKRSYTKTSFLYACKSVAFAMHVSKHRGHALTSCAIPESHLESTYTKRFAFYQAGKCLIQTLLFDHPKISLLKLTESTNNVVSSLQGLPPIETRTNLETLLVGFYAGKAGELFNGVQEMASYQPLSLLKNRDTVYALRPRKDLVRVNGLFVNGGTFRAKRTFQAKTKVSQITYSCDSLCAVYTKQLQKLPTHAKRSFALHVSKAYKSGAFVQAVAFARSKASHSVFFGENVVKTKGSVNVKKVGQVQTRGIDTNKARLRNDVIESDGQIKNALPLIDVLLREQYDSLSVSLGHFALANRLNCAKIEGFLSQSDTGLLERIKATFIVQSILVNGSIYSPNLLCLQKNSIVGNLNKTEIKDKKVLSLFQSLEEQIKNVYLQKDILNRSFGSNNSFLTNTYKKEFITKPKLVTEPLGSQAFQSTEASPSNNEMFATPTNTLLFSKKTNIISQKNEISALCEEIVCKSLTFSIKPYGHWFRIYLPQIETHQRQPVLADQFFKKRRELGFFEYTNVNLFELCFRTDFRDLVLPKFESVSIAYKNPVYAKHGLDFTTPSLSYTSSKISFLKVNQRLEAKVQMALPPTLNVLAQRFAHVWPQELGYGLCHHLVLNTFSRAFNLISKNRELLDILADHLIRFEKIRMPEISRICDSYANPSNISATLIDKNSILAVTRP